MFVAWVAAQYTTVLDSLQRKNRDEVLLHMELEHVSEPVDGRPPVLMHT